jgi:hypothetical protein
MTYPANWIVVNNVVKSFAEYQDVQKMDQRLFEANEGLVEEGIEDQLTRGTTRILYLIRNTPWWSSYYIRQSGANINPVIFTSGLISLPTPDPNRIQARQADFTDLCVFYTLFEYILPKIADFSNEDNSEVRKIGLYKEKFGRLFDELIQDGAWYDFDGTGTITAAEKMPTVTNIRRTR